MSAVPLQMAFAVVLSFVMSASVGTQSSKSEQTAKPAQAGTTIVGCLVHGNPPRFTALPADSSAADANDYFVRTPTVAVPVGTTVAVGKPGTTSTATSTGTPAADSYYRVTGIDRAQLRPHVGHRVEIQGTLSPRKPDAAAGGVTNTKTTVDAAGKPKVTVEARVDVVGDLQATTLKMVSATCP